MGHFTIRPIYPNGVPEWTRHAACAGQTEVMFPVVDRGHHGDTYTEARALCDSCPVLASCRQYVITKPELERHGFFAGMTPRDIQRERKAWRARRAAA